MPELARLVRDDHRDPCIDAIASTQAGQSMGLRDAQARAKGSVDAAMLANPISFGTLPIHELLDAHGLLAQLRAKGYQVLAPE